MDARGVAGPGGPADTSSARSSAARDRGAEPPGSARRARVLAWVLQVAALATAVGAGAVGGLPVEVGVLLLLVLAAAVCVNRQALFSFEISVTAEASVVLCAVVLYRADAPLLAPMVIGLAAGWLDSFHWSSRAWTPMAFNSGTRAIEALLAALAFGAVGGTGAHDTYALVAAAALAALVFACTDLVLFTALVVIRDAQPIGNAAREVWRVDAVSFPLALLGAAVGLLGDATEPWIGAVAVLPAAALPDALLAARRRISWRRLAVSAARAAAAIAVVAVVAVVAVAGTFGGFPSLPVTVALVALGVVAGVEVVGDRRLPVAPALAAAVLLAVVAVGPSDAVVASAVVAVVAASLSWSLSPTVGPHVRGTAAACTVGTAIACGLVLGVGATAAAACVVFLAGVVVAAPGRRTAAAVGWSFPFVALGATAASVRPWASVLVTLGIGGAALVGGALVVAWSGAPPWSSRVATRWARGRLLLSHRAVWLVLGALALVATGIGVWATGPLDSVAVVALALVVDVAAAVAVTRVRLWRFVRSRRWADATLLDVAAAGAWGAGAWAASRPGAAWAVAVAAAAITFAVGATTIAVADRAETSARRHRDREHLDAGP